MRHAVWLRRSARLAESVLHETVGFMVVPYIHGVIDHISRLNQRTMYKPTRKIQLFLRPVKEARDPLLSGDI